MNPLWHTHIVSGKEWLIDPFADWLYPALQRNHDDGKRRILKWFWIEHCTVFSLMKSFDLIFSDEGSCPMSTIWRAPHRRWCGWSGNLFLHITNMFPIFFKPSCIYSQTFQKQLYIPNMFPIFSKSVVYFSLSSTRASWRLWKMQQRSKERFVE